MAKESKIGSIREELSRIASLSDRQDIFAPTMTASWSYTQVLVIGKMKMQTFEIDVLREILKSIPSGAGERRFWQVADATDLAALGERLDRKCQVIQFQQCKLQAVK